MNSIFRLFRVTLALAFALLIVLPAIAGAQEIPITTKSDDARKIFLEARQWLDKGRYNEARDLFLKAIEKDPDFATAHINLAFVYQAVYGISAPELKNHLQKAVALAPKVSAGERLVIEAMQAGAENNPVKSIQLWEQVVQKYPNDKRAHAFLGYSYYNRDEDDKAIAEFEKAIKIDQDYAEPYNSLGYAYYEKGDYGKAEEAFKTYIRLLPDEANPHDSIADMYTKMGRHTEAIEHYKKAVELNPTFAFSQRKLGTNLIFLGKYEEGREAYRKAMAMETVPAGKVSGMRALARSYVYEGKFQPAMVEFDNVLKMAAEANLPEQVATTHAGKCDLYIEMGDFDKAEQSLAECKKVVTSSDLSSAMKENFAKGALFDEARIAAKRKDFTKAMAKADEYKAQIEKGKDPKEMANYHALIAQIYFDKGEYAKAIEHLKQADQENPYTLYLSAVAESKAGDKVKAVELFKKVANWNEDSLDYAFVRSKAMMAIKQEVPN